MQILIDTLLSVPSNSGELPLNDYYGQEDDGKMHGLWGWGSGMALGGMGGQVSSTSKYERHLAGRLQRG